MTLSPFRLGENPNVRVGVAMITSNHVRYIVHAAESVLAQVTDFPFEIVLGDDLSTDGTRELVKDLAAKHPGRIRLLLHEKNLGHCGKFNLVATIRSCDGEYVALLEGDDFWNDPKKLQRQVDYLDAHPECSGSAHEVWELRMGGEVYRYPRDYPGEVRLELRDILAHGFPLTSSIMYRRTVFGDFPDWYFEMQMGDWPLAVLCMAVAPFAYLRGEPASTYRLHHTSYWNSQPLVRRTLEEIKAYSAFRRFLGERHADLIDRELNLRDLYLSIGHEEEGDGRKARAAFRRFLKGYHRHRPIGPRPVLRHALKLAVPQAFTLAKRIRDRFSK
ncbi:MAG: glycosyltransferase [Verrucomicrobiota bacterium]